MFTLYMACLTFHQYLLNILQYCFATLYAARQSPCGQFNIARNCETVFSMFQSIDIPGLARKTGLSTQTIITITFAFVCSMHSSIFFSPLSTIATLLFWFPFILLSWCWSDFLLRDQTSMSKATGTKPITATNPPMRCGIDYFTACWLLLLGYHP